jgi:hypothetical protein
VPICKCVELKRNDLQSVKPDPESLARKRKGIVGLFETILRKFKILVHVGILAPLYALGALCIGAALVPGITMFRWSTDYFAQSPDLVRALAWGTSIAAGYFTYGFSLVLLLPAANFILRGKPREFRGPYYSAECVRWYLHNALTYLMRYTFLEFLTPTPLNILFYRLMGMKIGRGVQINSTHISDPALIELGDRVTVGGSAVIVAHYGQGGYLVLAPVRIGSGATIGLRATVMGGAVIGEHAKILPNSVVLPKTVVPAGEVWGGVPAQKVELKRAA